MNDINIHQSYFFCYDKSWQKSNVIWLRKIRNPSKKGKNVSSFFLYKRQVQYFVDFCVLYPFCLVSILIFCCNILIYLWPGKKTKQMGFCRTPSILFSVLINLVLKECTFLCTGINKSKSNTNETSIKLHIFI